MWPIVITSYSPYFALISFLIFSLHLLAELTTRPGSTVIMFFSPVVDTLPAIFVLSTHFDVLQVTKAFIVVVYVSCITSGFKYKSLRNRTQYVSPVLLLSLYDALLSFWQPVLEQHVNFARYIIWSNIFSKRCWGNESQDKSYLWLSLRRMYCNNNQKSGRCVRHEHLFRKPCLEF